mgnify:CR=1 FL=1|tara:strand:- start:5813 stop:6580 length:768 start_codon:yes stop_codon:yes gene_type:complete
MAFIFYDDSKHHGWGFSIGTFAICEHDPTKELRRIVEKSGYDPEHFEFKSSSPMKDDPNLQAMRDELRSFIQWKCKVAVSVVDGDKRLGPAGIELLKQMLQHERLKGQSHQIFFDEGLFSSREFAEEVLANTCGVEGCEVHFEQDSKSIIGIQIADLVAHTCGTMLLDALGKPMNLVKVDNSGYDDDVDVDLGFELWAGVRYAFLSTQKQTIEDDFDFAVVDVSTYGLLVDESVSNHVEKAARKRFGEMYLGCIH